MRGDLVASWVLDLEAVLRPDFKRIAIPSRDGEVLVIHAMADLLYWADAVLVAWGQCHSTCAYLWLATKRRELGKNADLALRAAFEDAGPNGFGQLWLRGLGRTDLECWARSGSIGQPVGWP